jgi:hypothetical protein
MTIPSGLSPSLVLAALLAGAPALAAPPAGRVELPPRPASAVATAAPTPPPAAPVEPAEPLADACPARLPVRQTIAQDIAGWTAQNQEAGYPFARVTFFPGPPAQSTLIVPTSEYKGAAGLHDVWDLPRSASGYWVACGYGNTTVSIAKKLPDNVAYCQADYDGRFLTLVVKHWSCGEKRPAVAATRPVAKPARSAVSKPTPKPTYKRSD